jgi:HEAT repeat protein
MAEDKVVDRARKLLADGKAETAELLLLQAGWDGAQAAAAREAYAELFPPNPILKERLAGVLAELRADNPKTARRAAAHIVREALGEATPANTAWLRSPLTTGVLIDALGSSDPIVVDAALISLCRIASVHFRDQRAHPALAGLLESPRWLTRMWAVRCVATLRRADAFRQLKPLLTDEVAFVRRQAFDWLERARALDALSEKAQGELEQAAMAALEDPDAEVKGRAAVVLAAMGGEEALHALERVSDRSRPVTTAVPWAIQQIRARSAG